MTNYFERLRNAQMMLAQSAELQNGDLRNYDASVGLFRIKHQERPIIGLSQQMRVLFYLLNLYANNNDNVLILGNSGTGKELAAMALHYNSPRYNPRVDNFVVINCSSIPESLIESELFGYTRGAFTGAEKTGRLGAFHRAAGGTIVLDEIADMPFHLQPRLLRVVEEKKIKKVGSDEYTDLRETKIVASTNRDLIQMVREGTFRHDLLQRLSVLPLYTPTILERGRDEIAILINYFATGSIKPSEEISPDAYKTVIQLSLPGNVRTLENLIKQAKVFGNGRITQESILAAVPYIEAIDAAYPLSYDVTDDSVAKVDSSRDEGSSPPNTFNLDALERWAVWEAMKASFGVRSKAAELLGIHHETLRAKLSKYSKEPKIE